MVLVLDSWNRPREEILSIARQNLMAGPAPERSELMGGGEVLGFQGDDFCAARVLVLEKLALQAKLHSVRLVLSPRVVELGLEVSLTTLLLPLTLNDGDANRLVDGHRALNGPGHRR